MSEEKGFTRQRRRILALLLAIPGGLMSGFGVMREQPRARTEKVPSSASITVSIHPHAVARVKRRESKEH